MFIDSCRMRTPRIEANAGLRAHMSPARWLSMCDCATGWNVKPKAEHTSPSMSAKSLDFGIVSRRDGTFESTVVKKDSLVAMLPPNHPLAQAKSVPATIFEREPYIEIHTGLQTDNTLCFRSRGIVPSCRA